MKRKPFLYGVTCLFLLAGGSAINAAVFNTFDSDATGYSTGDTLGDDFDQLNFDGAGVPDGSEQTDLAYQVTSDAFGSDIDAGTTLRFKGAIFEGSAGSTPEVTVRLMSDGGNTPGDTVIASWTFSNFDTVGDAKADLSTHDAVSTAAITQNSTYWLAWEVSSGDAIDAVRFHYSTDNTTDDLFSDQLDDSGDWNAQSSGPVGAFEITAVPEPGEYALMAGMLLIGFGVYRRHRTRRA